MKCSWAAERSLSSEARHFAMKSPGVMAFGSGVGMVVSWVFLVLPAGGVIIRCVESWACRQSGTPGGEIRAYRLLAAVPKLGTRPSPREVFDSPCVAFGRATLTRVVVPVFPLTYCRASIVRGFSPSRE